MNTSVVQVCLINYFFITKCYLKHNFYLIFG